MHKTEEVSTEGFRQKRSSTPALGWIMVAAIILICATFLFAKYRHERSIREMRRAIQLAGGIDHRVDIRIVQFKGPEITDSNLSSVRSLTETETLELFSTRVTDDGLAAISEWTSLRNLFLNGTPLTDSSLDVIRNFGKLEWLQLGGAQVTDSGLGKLAALKNLRKLNLNGCTMITQAGVQRLQAALPTCRIEWSSDPWVPIKDPAE